jgi:capsular exopolysaccharide synthesis family protein
MGKIVDALKVAHGEVAELVLKSLEEPDGLELDAQAPVEAPQFREPAAHRVLPLSRRIPKQSEAAPEAAPPEAPIEAPVRTTRPDRAVGRWQIRALPLPVSDAAPLLSTRPTHANAAEQYRFVCTRVRHHPSATATIVVSSPGIGDGKTVTTINLAAAFAQSGDEQVLLIDGDLRCSSVHAYLHVPRSPGLGELLAGKGSLQEAIFRVEQVPGLCIMPAGTAAGNPTELLGSSRWPALVKTLREHFDRVIVDCPPVEAVADYDLIAAGCDGAILVVRPDHTNRALCLRALEKTRKKLLGALINCTADRLLQKQYLSYYQSRREEKA